MDTFLRRTLFVPYKHSFYTLFNSFKKAKTIFKQLKQLLSQKILDYWNLIKIVSVAKSFFLKKRKL